MTRMGSGEIDANISNYALGALEIDQLGLDNLDRKMLETIIRFYDGGPVGLDTLAATLGEDENGRYVIFEGVLLRLVYGLC